VAGIDGAEGGGCREWSKLMTLTNELDGYDVVFKGIGLWCSRSVSDARCVNQVD